MDGGGHAVDLFGPAVEVTEWMGVLPQIQAARTRTRVISFVRPGRRPVDVHAEALAEGVSDRHIEILRGDLASILYQPIRDTVQYVFDDSVTAITEAGARIPGPIVGERPALVLGRRDGVTGTARRGHRQSAGGGAMSCRQPLTASAARS